MYYFAAWTECGCFLGCFHEHKTIIEAKSCIPCAGGYVVAVQNGAMRALTAEEEFEFQCVVPRHSTNNCTVETTPAAPEAAGHDPGYAVMIRIRVGDRWSWTTWMCFETYAEAAAHAREGNEVVGFRSPEWAALRPQTGAASPSIMKAPRESVPPRGEAETLFEFVLRWLRAYGFAQGR